jgi:branched-chain amino acid transport system ATP-binding protein
MRTAIAMKPVAEATIATQPANEAASRYCAPARLQVENLTAAYGRVQVIHGVDLEAREGELLALLGPNGAGKSSLLGALAGLVRAQGSVRAGGKELTRVPAHVRARMGLALVPEVRGNLFQTMTVEENLQIALRELPHGERESLLREIHAMFPILQERAEALSGMLSGGEQQMLAVAVALGRRPQVLLFDEPTQGLAPTVFDVLLRVFSILKAKGIAVVLAEQNVGFAARCADRFLVLAGGRVTLRGDGRELDDQDRLMAAYMGKVWEVRND